MKTKIFAPKRMKWHRLAALGIASLMYSHTTMADTPVWKYASWGRAYLWVFTMNEGKSWHINGETDDIDASDGGRNDGYCVYLRIRRYGESWSDTTTANREQTKSCGASHHFFLELPGKIVTGIRMYRDDGRYLTISGS